MSGRIIEGPQDIAEGAAWLATREPRFAEAMERVGEIPLRRRAEGFGALMSMIVSQQVSLASAAAIWHRLKAAGLAAPAPVAAAPAERLRALGLSAPKVRYVQALARSGFDFAALGALGDEAAIEELIEIKGIGRWTAEIYVMFSLGRADVFAGGDLALQSAARALFGLEDRPDEAALRAMAEAWSPWRGVAARLLWAYYRATTRRDGVWRQATCPDFAVGPDD